MKHTITQSTIEVSSQYERSDYPEMDRSLLQGLPCRFHQHGRSVLKPSKDWYTSWFWLRVPLLLLGSIGALGLLAKYNPRFAKAFSMIRWPDRTTSIALLSIAGVIILFLCLDWMYGKVIKRPRVLRSEEQTKRINWRTQ